MKGSILFSENLVALLPVSHHLADASSLKLSQLREDGFIMFPRGYILREILVEACQQQGFQPTVAFEGEDIDAIRGLVSAGLGVTVIPEITLIDGLPRATVKVPIIEPNVTRTVGIIIPRERQLLPTQNLFYHFLIDFFTRLDKFQD